LIQSIHPGNYNLIENPILHYGLSVGEVGPDNPSKASNSIGRVVIHELMNYLSMKRRAIDNGEEVIAYSIEIHLTKAGSFIAADSGKTTVVTAKVKKETNNDVNDDKSEISKDKENKSNEEIEKDKKTNKEKNKSNKIGKILVTLEHILSFYKEKLKSDPDNPFYQSKISELKSKILNLKMRKIQEEMSKRAFSMVKGNSKNILSCLVNGEILDEIA
jgi:uncharacterized protein (DUF697 family)